jgi:hypothetical protein
MRTVSSDKLFAARVSDIADKAAGLDPILEPMDRRRATPPRVLQFALKCRAFAAPRLLPWRAGRLHAARRSGVQQQSGGTFPSADNRTAAADV